MTGFKPFSALAFRFVVHVGELRVEINRSKLYDEPHHEDRIGSTEEAFIKSVSGGRRHNVCI